MAMTPRTTLTTLLALLALGFGAPAPCRARQEAPPPAAAKAATRSDLLLDDLFPKKPFFGKTAQSLAWSFDDRYLAYRWNPYDDKGWDLWVYDTREKKARRLTSIELFAAFDRELPEIIARYKKDKEEDERRKGLSDEERRKLEDEDTKKERDRKEPLKEYAGVGEFVWAHRSNELLFTYKGDIYRMKVTDEKPTRLTKTQEPESGVKYTRDDSGFLFRRGSGIYRMRFDSACVEQLDPKLPNDMHPSDYRLSPDETKLLVSCSRQTGPDREVTYITYRDRFATAKTTSRAVADDPVKSESYLFVCDLSDDPKSDGKPWEIYKWADGAELGFASIHEEPWSPDSKQVVYATWKRDRRELEIVVADLAEHKVKTVYKTTEVGEHTSPGMTDPFFTPDGKRILALIEAGFRHVWVIDPLTSSATQLTRGEFEVYPQKLTEDGKYLFVRSTKDSPARVGLYRVDMADGTMVRLGEREGNYQSLTLSHDARHIATTLGSWRSPTELYIVEAKEKGRCQVLTSSHSGNFEKVARLYPELFTFKNRGGLTIYGFLFKPQGLKKTDKRPLLLYTYGGPLGTGHQVVDGAFGSDNYLFAMYMAARYGFVTATIDPRGSSGYGGLFGAANWESPGKAQVEDLSDGVKFLIENYGVDPKRVGIHGWSFGGFQTQMCMYTAPDVFTLGIAGAGPTEWQNYNYWYSGGVIGKARTGKPEDLDKFSLTHLAKNLKGPLMLLHGMEDTNVLFQDTVKVYRELLKENKGPLVELVLDPTGGHGLGGDIRTRERFKMYEAFILRRWPEVAERAR